jgi:hypothetical protein
VLSGQGEVSIFAHDANILAAQLHLQRDHGSLPADGNTCKVGSEALLKIGKNHASQVSARVMTVK